jgi:hypothetical protein
MRIGSSPLYLLKTQKQQLETKTEHLKPTEREVQEKLKDKQIMLDKEESSATRVALRNLKDFALQSTQNNDIVWTYNFCPEKPDTPPATKNPTITIAPDPKTISNPTKQEQKDDAAIIDSSQTSHKKEQVVKEEPKSFLNKIEAFLDPQNIKIVAIEAVDKTKVIAIIQTESEQQMLFAFNKKRITEKELLTCYKHSVKKNLKYRIITKDTPTKKMSETIHAYKSLSTIQKLIN